MYLKKKPKRKPKKKVKPIDYTEYKTLSNKDRIELSFIKKGHTISTYNATIAKLDEMVTELKGKSYSLFLESKYWALIRQKILKRDNFKCFKCESRENIQVHHITYKNHFNEHRNLKDLITLCSICHKKEHKL